MKEPQDVNWRGQRPQFNPAPTPTSRGDSPPRQRVKDLILYHNYENSLEYLEYLYEQRLKSFLKG